MLGTTAARADDALFYLGAGVTRSALTNISNDNLAFSDIHTTSWKVLAGFRPISFFAVEADYLDLGGETSTFLDDPRSCTRTPRRSPPTPSVYRRCRCPTSTCSARLGLSRWSSMAPTRSCFPSDNGTEFACGVGAQLHVGIIGGRLEYESFNITNTYGAGSSPCR